MMRDGDGWIVSPSDLVDLVECELRSTLTHAVAAGLDGAPARGEGAPATLVGHGLTFEARVLAGFEAVFGDGVRRIGEPARSPAALAAAAAQTEGALSDGAPVIHQASFLRGGFQGRADFLVDSAYDPATGQRRPGREPGRYEPIDVKLARTARPAAVLQLTAYAQALADTGRPLPEHMHLLLGDGSRETLRVADFLPVLADVRARLDARLAAPAGLPERLWGDRCRGCATCAFAEHCRAGREQARDLSLVAGLRPDQRRRLHRAGVHTLDELATTAERPATLSERTWTSVQGQARLQLLQEASAGSENPGGTPVFEVVDALPLARMPEPNEGDLHFDMESHPLALGGHRLEYLFGVLTVDDEFTPIWGHDRGGEKAAFERFVDLAVERLARFPGAHVYHYAPYEPDALKRLAAVHGSRQDEVDHLLRSQALVDLYGVVRTALRVSLRSYSLKALEPLYMPQGRGGEVTTALGSIDAYERFLELRATGDEVEAEKQLGEIAAYNRYDCASTLGLQRWLLQIRAEHGITGAGAPEPAEEADPPALPAAAAELRAETERLREELVAGLPEGDLDGDQRARQLLADLLGYYRREANPDWWEFYAALEAPLSDLERSPSCAVPLSVEVGGWEEPTGRQVKVRRTVLFHCDPELPHPFGVQEQVRLLHPAAPGRPATAVTATVVGVSPETIELTETADPGDLPGSTPVAVLPGFPIQTDVKERALQRLARQVLATPGGLPATAAADLLRRRVPRLVGGGALPAVEAGVVPAVIAAVDELDDSYLSVQGPPGSGKTYLAARLITHLVAAGKTVAVCANSHKAIEHVLGRAHEADPTIPIAKRPKDSPSADASWAQPRDYRQLAAWRAAHPGGHLVGGTSWHLTQDVLAAEPFDVVIVDESGQFALADALAVAGSGRRVVLLGDPQQLPQVTRGTHPRGAGAAALGHVLGAADLVPPGLGYFLDTTRRMHADLCRPVSELSYRGELHADPCTERHRLEGVEPGLYVLPVPHEGNTTRSPEEVAATVELVQGLVGRGYERTGLPLRPEDVLVVAPFNRQVRALETAFLHAGLPGVRVGTVDRLQGQEAPVAVLSMTASSAAETPRGLDFLLSRNRLNVGLSRAESVAVVVCAPDLLRAPMSSVRQLRLVGGMLGLLEQARPWPNRS